MALWNIFLPASAPQLSAAEELRQLQNSLGPSESPKTRKRGRHEDHTPGNETALTTPSKKRVTTSRAGLESPDTTPIKQSSQISVISNIERAAKKLNFAIKQEPDTIQTMLPTPESTPQRKFRVIDVLEQEKHQQLTPPATPTKLSLSDDKENVSQITKTRSLYTRGKTLFLRSSKLPFTKHLPEREKESEALHNFLVNHIASSQGTSLYISGPPGTGKTAQCKLTLSHFVDTSRPHGGIQPVEVDGEDYKVGYTYVNCMALSKPESVFAELYTGLTGEKVHLKQSRDKLFEFLSSEKADMSVVVLDELDRLLQSRTEEIFTLFSWAISAKIVLIGISNALDMVDRLLPRLKMNGLSPNTLNFLPYSAEQIAKIIITKLKLLNDDEKDTSVPLFHPAAIQLCARKAASHTGDLRKAFDVCNAAIDVVERDWKKSANITDQTQDLPLVKIQHIARITNAAFNTSSISKLRGLNLSQKYLLCMLLRAEGSTVQALSVNSFYQFYIRHVSKDSQLVGILKKPEFLEVLGSLEASSAIRMHKTKTSFSDAKVISAVVKHEFMETIKGVYILEKLMQQK